MRREDVEALIMSGGPVELNGAALRSVDLSGLDLEDADLSYADLTDARLDNANLQRAILWSIVAVHTSFRRADLRHANLGAADLRGADLRGARLAGAKVQGTNLSGASLQFADLRPADLKGAILGPAAGTPASPEPWLGSADAGGPGSILIDEAGNGSHIRVAVGTRIEIVLSEGATGYVWELALDESAGLGNVIEAESRRFSPSPTTAAGAMGAATFPLVAVGRGDADVTLVSRQPWAARDASDERFRVSIEVQ